MTQTKTSENMSLAPGVVDTIISLTATEQDGVASIGTPASGFFAKLFNKPSTSGIDTKFDEDGKLKITLHIEVKYGFVLPDLANEIRKAIAEELKMQIGIEVSSIDIFIDGIQFEQN